MNKGKKYQINYNMSFYNPRTKSYQNKEGKDMTYEQAIQSKWKCEKCSQTFQNYKTLFNHKKEVHSY
jgi:hypothetical protein